MSHIIKVYLILMIILVSNVAFGQSSDLMNELNKQINQVSTQVNKSMTDIQKQTERSMQEWQKNVNQYQQNYNRQINAFNRQLQKQVNTSANYVNKQYVAPYSKSVSTAIRDAGNNVNRTSTFIANELNKNIERNVTPVVSKIIETSSSELSNFTNETGEEFRKEMENFSKSLESIPYDEVMIRAEIEEYSNEIREKSLRKGILNLTPSDLVPEKVKEPANEAMREVFYQSQIGLYEKIYGEKGEIILKNSPYYKEPANLAIDYAFTQDPLKLMYVYEPYTEKWVGVEDLPYHILESQQEQLWSTINILSQTDIYARQGGTYVNLVNDYSKSVHFLKSTSPVTVSYRKQSNTISKKDQELLNSFLEENTQMPVRTTYLFTIWINNYQYKNGQYAIKLAEGLIQKNYPSYIIRDSRYLRVYVGAFSSYEEAEAYMNEMLSDELIIGIHNLKIVEKPDYYFNHVICLKGYEFARVCNFIDSNNFSRSNFIFESIKTTVNSLFQINGILKDSYSTAKDFAGLFKDVFTNNKRYKYGN